MSQEDTINVIIVDDEALSRKVIRDFVEQTTFLHLVGEAEDAQQATELLQKNSIDCLLLDIEMPGMNGLELINITRHLPEVIIVTSNREYAVEAFDYDVTDFLVKPVNYARFFKGIQKVRERIRLRQNNQAEGGQRDTLDSSIFVKSDGKLNKVNLKNILYVEAYGDYVVINTLKERYTVHTTMKLMEKKLDDHNFMRVHRSYIVKLDEIQSIDEGIIVVNDKLVPLGKSYKERLMEKLNLLS